MWRLHPQSLLGLQLWKESLYLQLYGTTSYVATREPTLRCLLTLHLALKIDSPLVGRLIAGIITWMRKENMGELT